MACWQNGGFHRGLFRIPSSAEIPDNELEHQPAQKNRSPVSGGFDVNATRHEGYALRKLFHESDRLLIVKRLTRCGLAIPSSRS